MRYGIVAILLSSIVMTASAWMSEETIFTHYGEMVFRPDSTTLCIITTCGDTLSFVDIPYSETYGDYNVYTVISYFPEQNYWVLHIHGFEGIDWLLVNGNNGREDLTISEPTLSPGGTRFLCVSADLEVGEYYANGIQIWRIDEDSLALEFEDLDMPWEPHIVEWITDSVIVLNKEYWDWSTHEVEIQPGQLELSSDGTWVPDDPVSWD